MKIEECQCCKLPIIMCHNKLHGKYGGIVATNIAHSTGRMSTPKGMSDIGLISESWESYNLPDLKLERDNHG